LPNPPVLVTDWWVGGFTPVHRPGINVLYTDGHVRFHDISGVTYTSGSVEQYDIWYKLSLKQ